MKNIKSVILMVMMLLVLGAGVFLARNIQDTRKGASQAESSSSVLPSSVNGKIGQDVELTVYVNTGSATDEMSAAELLVEYDRAKLRYVGVEPVEPFILLNKDTVDSGSGNLALSLVMMSEYKSGAVAVAKVKFSPLVNATSTVKSGGKIVLKGPAQWTLATNNHSEIVVAEAVTTGECASNNDCAENKKCVNKKCELLTCPDVDMPECKKQGFLNHECVFVADSEKDGDTCRFNSILTGNCASGVCVAPTVVPEGKGKITFKLAYKGFAPGAKCGLNENNKVVVRKENGELVEIGDVGMSSGQSEIVVDSGSNMALFVKGPMHLQMKYSVDGQTSRYTSAGGKLETGKTYDFSKYPMMPGDVNGDGWINGQDFSIVKNKAVVYEEVDEGGFLMGDFDGSCQVNTRDLTLLVNSLDEKQDELY